ncbi:SIR2 family protein (plasmid) [Rhizobium ruizarguesonis]|uniref:SIR2 family protein n=1 Tax=Rhizobium ruizarguesonis TaxID=2081791 RepID=UPI001031CD45|nr:SIR2 family protein [Rhizobium ruizarguesonis]TAT97833.1 SIR2 family protein [Rhizobium ruizarguesonis]
MSAHSTSLSWCEEDQHATYQHFRSFNEWLDEKGEDAEKVLERYGLLNIAAPSKALFAGDPTAYEQEVDRYFQGKRDFALGIDFFDDLWFRKNKAHFGQLIEHLKGQSVVPFIGAGISCTSGYPGWSQHLLNHAIASGLKDAERRIDEGLHEEIIDELIKANKLPLFVQGMKDDFLEEPTSLDLQMLIASLCKHVIVTTNYDLCIEKALAASGGAYVTPISSTEADNQDLIFACSNRRRALLKLHGTITSAGNCILSKANYDAAYGDAYLDMRLPIPKKLRRLYEHVSLLFVGCSLIADRTMNVFLALKEELGENVPQHFAILEAPADAGQLPTRNAFLSQHGITPIWYPKGEHERLPDMLAAMSDTVHR